MARPPVEVRPATVDDVDDFLPLWFQARRELVRAGRHMAAGYVRPRIVEAIATRKQEILLARWDGTPAGYALVRSTPPLLAIDCPTMMIDQIFVVPGMRRHGVAHALLTAVLGRAERTGAEQVVTSVSPWARDTHRFFARLGFSPLIVLRAAPIGTLRRRLSGESPRGALDDLLWRRRSLRARSRRARTNGADLAIDGHPGADLDGADLDEDLNEGLADELVDLDALDVVPEPALAGDDVVDAGLPVDVGREASR